MKPRRQVEAAVEEFNKYRSSEVVAKIIEFSEGQATIELSGPFCVSCGVYDYFDDLRIELEKKTNASFEISKIEGGEGEGYLITYRKLAK